MHGPDISEWGLDAWLFLKVAITLGPLRSLLTHATSSTHLSLSGGCLKRQLKCSVFAGYFFQRLAISLFLDSRVKLPVHPPMRTLNYQ